MSATNLVDRRVSQNERIAMAIEKLVCLSLVLVSLSAAVYFTLVIARRPERSKLVQGCY